MKQKPKRAPGGGRKPTGPFAKNAAQLTIRMPTDMRGQLELSASKRQNGNGWSLTQEMLYRLQQSMDRERDERRDPASRALAYLLGEIVLHVAAVTGDTGSKWRSNPFAFRAIKLALALVLDALEPKGKMEAPRTKEQPIHGDAWIRGVHFEIPGNTPEELAKSVRDQLLFQLARDLKEPLAPSGTFTRRTELAMLQAARALLLRGD